MQRGVLGHRHGSDIRAGFDVQALLELKREKAKMQIELQRLQNRVVAAKVRGRQNPICLTRAEGTMASVAALVWCKQPACWAVLPRGLRVC